VVEPKKKKKVEGEKHLVGYITSLPYPWASHASWNSIKSSKNILNYSKNKLLLQ
jgi:hypothetical protein